MIDKEDGPRPTGKPAQDVSLAGAAFPWRDGQPVLVSMPGASSLYLPCFNKVEELKSFLGRWGVEYESIKRIDDVSEFLSSIGPQVADGQIKVIIDPWTTDSGRIRFMEFQPGLSN